MSEVEPLTKRVSPADKRDATDAAALAIIEKEAADRHKKTERLRALRLAQPAPPPEKKKRSR